MTEGEFRSCMIQIYGLENDVDALNFLFGKFDTNFNDKVGKVEFRDFLKLAKQHGGNVWWFYLWLYIPNFWKKIMGRN